MIGTPLTQSVAFIGLGSNLGDRLAYLRAAINAIKLLGDPIAISSVYESEPHGVDEDQPIYLNMVLAIKTQFEPMELL
ncbi:MAG: 2-amino-4-hydroxy-6-hydroxymethyldihydropteridine diphosphokinase, partial [Chloroflexi bacterium]|nr:2-amino-4-hydroxy-6-hydroxymethyldihydropteridine diphosphokinase [Chloroflexota bacterium]